MAKLNKLYIFFDFERKYKYKSIKDFLNDKEGIYQKKYEDERIDILKNYVLDLIDKVMEELVLFYFCASELEEEELTDKIIDIVKETYNYFYWLRPLSQYWFDATFKLIYQKINLQIQLGKYPPKDFSHYKTLFINLEKVRYLCNKIHTEEIDSDIGSIISSSDDSLSVGSSVGSYYQIDE